MGLIRGIPTDWSEEDIMDNISVPIGCGKVVKVRRLNYKVNINGSATWKPSQSAVITFDGQVLPKRVFVCYNSVPVDIYIFPTIQCYKCCRYGHTKTMCRSTPRCYKCGQGHSGEMCDVSEESATCIMCTGFHFANSKACPEFNRQKQIKHSMAHSCISYMEASKLYPPVSKSYADVLTTPPPFISKPLSSSTINMHHTSYRKTVPQKPHLPPRSTTKGYDQAAHKALLKEFQIPSPNNGCALNSSSSNNSSSDHNPNSDLIHLLLNLFNKLISNNIIEPSHVASMYEILNKSALNHGLQDNPVELSECNSQEK